MGALLDKGDESYPPYKVLELCRNFTKAQIAELEELRAYKTQMQDWLVEVKEYIEGVEELIEGRMGSCRLLKQLLEERAMPNIYYELLERINNVQKNDGKVE